MDMSRHCAQGFCDGRRPLKRIFLACVASVLIVLPDIAMAGSAAGGGTDDGVPIVAEAERSERAIVAAWNSRRWDDLAPLYAQDVLLLVPNHEPVQGRDAAMDYFRSVRDVVGEIADDYEHLRVKDNGDSVGIAGVFSVESGHVRLWYTDLYERQPDGSMQIVVNAFAFRERAAG